MAVSFSGPTAEQVEQAVRELRDSNPAQQQLTLDQVVQRLYPQVVALVKVGELDSILWAESVSNTLKDLGRSGFAHRQAPTQ